MRSHRKETGGPWLFWENFQGNVGFEPEQGKLDNTGFLGMGNKM